MDLGIGDGLCELLVQTTYPVNAGVHDLSPQWWHQGNEDHAGVPEGQLRRVFHMPKHWIVSGRAEVVIRVAGKSEENPTRETVR